jgi:prevent-host-death family protein
MVARVEGTPPSGATLCSTMAESVGVRELRQNLSKYLERVKDGEDLVVTERGKVVARLVPAREAEVDPFYLMLAEKYGATIPTGKMEDVIDNLPPGTPMPPEEYEAMFAEMRSEWWERQ